MSETIQRFKVVKRCDRECECTADTDLQDDGPLMLVEDHESALAEAQAEIERLREEGSRIIGERSDEILALREVISSQDEVLADLKRELQEARDRASAMSNTIANIADTCRSRGFEAKRPFQPLDERVIAMAQDPDQLQACLDVAETTIEQSVSLLTESRTASGIVQLTEYLKSARSAKG